MAPPPPSGTGLTLRRSISLARPETPLDWKLCLLLLDLEDPGTAIKNEREADWLEGKPIRTFLPICNNFLGKNNDIQTRVNE